MSRLLSRVVGFFSSKTVVGVDKHGNRYFTRKEEIDGILKEKRMVIFKGEEDPRSLPVEWICWLNGQRKKPPTPEEMAELDARREHVKQNIERLKEEELRKSKVSNQKPRANTGKVEGPDLRSFIQQLKDASLDQIREETTGKSSQPESTGKRQSDSVESSQEPLSSEPTGSGASFKPGTWRPPG